MSRSGRRRRPRGGPRAPYGAAGPRRAGRRGPGRQLPPRRAPHPGPPRGGLPGLPATPAVPGIVPHLAADAAAARDGDHPAVRRAGRDHRARRRRRRKPAARGHLRAGHGPGGRGRPDRPGRRGGGVPAPRGSPSGRRARRGREPDERRDRPRAVRRGGRGGAPRHPEPGLDRADAGHHGARWSGHRPGPGRRGQAGPGPGLGRGTAAAREPRDPLPRLRAGRPGRRVRGAGRRHGRGARRHRTHGGQRGAAAGHRLLELPGPATQRRALRAPGPGCPAGARRHPPPRPDHPGARRPRRRRCGDRAAGGVAVRRAAGGLPAAKPGRPTGVAEHDVRAVRHRVDRNARRNLARGRAGPAAEPAQPVPVGVPHRRGRPVDPGAPGPDPAAGAAARGPRRGR